MGCFRSRRVSWQAVCRKERPPEIAILSCPRGNGKSWLCGKLIARSMTPGDPLFEPSVENILVSSVYESGAYRVGVRSGGVG